MVVAFLLRAEMEEIVQFAFPRVIRPGLWKFVTFIQ